MERKKEKREQTLAREKIKLQLEQDRREREDIQRSGVLKWPDRNIIRFIISM